MIEVEIVGEQRDCKHCSRTYGTLGCCSTVSNKWVYSCEEGHREYEETHKHMTIPETKGRLESFIDTFNICKEHDNSLVDVSIGKEDIQAFTMAIKSLEAWEKLRTEIMAIGNWRNESEISDNGVKDCLAIIDRHIAEIRGD